MLCVYHLGGELPSIPLFSSCGFSGIFSPSVKTWMRSNSISKSSLHRGWLFGEAAAPSPSLSLLSLVNKTWLQLQGSRGVKFRSGHEMHGEDKNSSFVAIVEKKTDWYEVCAVNGACTASVWIHFCRYQALLSPPFRLFVLTKNKTTNRPRSQTARTSSNTLAQPWKATIITGTLRKEKVRTGMWWNRLVFLF